MVAYDHLTLLVGAAVLVAGSYAAIVLRRRLVDRPPSLDLDRRRWLAALTAVALGVAYAIEQRRPRADAQPPVGGGAAREPAPDRCNPVPAGRVCHITAFRLIASPWVVRGTADVDATVRVA